MPVWALQLPMAATNSGSAARACCMNRRTRVVLPLPASPATKHTWPCPARALSRHPLRYSSSLSRSTKTCSFISQLSSQVRTCAAPLLLLNWRGLPSEEGESAPRDFGTSVPQIVLDQENSHDRFRFWHSSSHRRIRCSSTTLRLSATGIGVVGSLGPKVGKREVASSATPAH
jgi:hypothetical protein